jgi:glycosyltransferase involved in cell wall biosynthesis
MKNQRILLVYPSFSTFVERDYAILSDQYEVDKHQVVFADVSFKSVSIFVREVFFYLTKIGHYRAVVIWFGDYHSFLPTFFSKIFSRKSYVIIGGGDVASLSDINYGSFSKPLRAFCTRKSFQWATLCLPVVEDLEEKLMHWVPTAKSQVIYTGYNPDVFKKNNEVAKKKQVLTVSITRTQSRLKLKGLDRFIDLAKTLPDYDFVIVGIKEANMDLFSSLPSNVKIIPPCDFNQLIRYYSESQFYAQFSLSEGLPNAICEAMLCECVPLGTDVGGVRTAIGDTGFVADWNVEAFSDYIKIYDTTQELGLKSREYVKEMFTQEQRVESLLHVVS